LLQPIEASEEARERVRIILLTLTGQWSVKEGMQRLGISRTRFQDLRRRMLGGAVEMLEPGLPGRPPKRVAQEEPSIRSLRRELLELMRELRIARTRLELLESPAADAVRERTRSVASRKKRRS